MNTTRYDETFYEDVLRKHTGDETIQVHSVTAEPAVPKGNNFLSDLLRIRLNLTRSSPSRVTETRSFILKREPIGDARLMEMVQSQELFTVELSILRDVMPRIEAALGVRLGPKFVYGSDQPPRCILMEDLTPEGFYVKNKQQGLSMVHATMAMKNLARFHAGSVALLEENPKTLRGYTQGIYNGSIHPNFYVLTLNSLVRLSEEAAKWSDEGSALSAKKLREIVASFKERVENVYKYDADEFCVLNHGDVWINNMLFIEDQNGQPIEQVFVDFQMSGFSSPAIDLLYFLNINPALEVRGHGEEILLETYLETLTTSMKKLKCHTLPPTMKSLKDAMHRRRVYAIVSGLFLLPRMMLNTEDVESMDQLLKDGTSKANAYENPNTIRMLKRILPLMSDRGYLDY